MTTSKREHANPGTRIEKILREHRFLPATISGRQLSSVAPGTSFVGVLKEKRGNVLFDELAGTQVVQVGLVRLSDGLVSVYAYGSAFEEELRDVLSELTRAFETSGEYLQTEETERTIDTMGTSSWSSASSRR